MANGKYAGDILSADAWTILEQDRSSVLIDVRTTAEWAYVGMPDLTALGKRPVLVEWLTFPSMQVNPGFATEIQAAGITPVSKLLFLCRSGARSRSAAVTMTAMGFSGCYNIADGFEGDPDGSRHRGNLSGWKVAGLPWVQS